MKFANINKPKLGTIEGDYHSQPDNFEHGKLREDRAPLAETIDVYEGERIFLTRNINKDTNVVNGLKCEVISLEPRPGGTSFH